MKSFKKLCSVYFSQLYFFISQSPEVVRLANEDKPYFSLTAEEIYKMSIETRIWLARNAIRLFRIKDEEQINKIKSWYQIPEKMEI